MPFIDFLKTVLAGNRLNVAKRFPVQRGVISGGMSRFCRASDSETGRIVGLKIVDLKKLAAYECRFKGLVKPSEGEISVQLRHSNIVHTFEHGITTEGSPYLIIEYLEGPNLRSALASRAFCLANRRIHFLQQAAEAIAATHEAGFIHRNICPRHFILTNNQNDIKLIDFGMSLPATGDFMRPGNRSGTLDYMAPELIRLQPTDQRLDIFAFGVTAYEMCSFELPWPHGTTGASVMSHEQPAIDIRQYCPGIAPMLAKAIHSCIESDVSSRCPSMRAFLQMIRDVPIDGGIG